MKSGSVGGTTQKKKGEWRKRNVEGDNRVENGGQGTETDRERCAHAL